eukprot:GHVQ01035302.1.p1 GENE.GHVQ01035302.1~~GHVQ01035302.1.p1  ORF type:complete len:535 (+),score=28.63 GHVQ01035302.1:468-2072(+)
MLAFVFSKVMVFDGIPLKAKEETHNERKRLRQENVALAEQMEKLHGRNHPETIKYKNRCIEITPKDTRNLILELRKHNIQYIIAPYEADAQMAYLARSGFVDIVITEDSDLIVYGCKQILFKLDHIGACLSISSERLVLADILPRSHFKHDLLALVCILSGCDYVKSVKGVGLRTAAKLVSKRGANFYEIIKDLEDGGYTIPPKYATKVRQAIVAFRYQTVYDPVTRSTTRVRPVPPTQPLSPQELRIAGPELSKEVAEKICTGELNPITLDPYDPQAQCVTPPKTTQPNSSLTTGSASSTAPLTRSPSASRDHSCTPKSYQLLSSMLRPRTDPYSLLVTQLTDPSPLCLTFPNAASRSGGFTAHSPSHSSVLVFSPTPITDSRGPSGLVLSNSPDKPPKVTHSVCPATPCPYLATHNPGNRATKDPLALYPTRDKRSGIPALCPTTITPFKLPRPHTATQIKERGQSADDATDRKRPRQQVSVPRAVGACKRQVVRKEGCGSSSSVAVLDTTWLLQCMKDGTPVQPRNSQILQ